MLKIELKYNLTEYFYVLKFIPALKCSKDISFKRSSPLCQLFNECICVSLEKILVSNHNFRVRIRWEMFSGWSHQHAIFYQPFELCSYKTHQTIIYRISYEVINKSIRDVNYGTPKLAEFYKYRLRRPCSRLDQRQRVRLQPKLIDPLVHFYSKFNDSCRRGVSRLKLLFYVMTAAFCNYSRFYSYIFPCRNVEKKQRIILYHTRGCLSLNAKNDRWFFFILSTLSVISSFLSTKNDLIFVCVCFMRYEKKSLGIYYVENCKSCDKVEQGAKQCGLLPRNFTFGPSWTNIRRILKLGCVDSTNFYSRFVYLRVLVCSGVISASFSSPWRFLLPWRSW